MNYVEYALGSLLYRRRGYEEQLFTKSAAFDKFPEPTFELESPDCGPSYAKLTKDYSMFGEGRMPELKWSPAVAAAGSDVKEFLLISEDVDAPFGQPNVHGIYCFIPATMTSLSAKDFEVVEGEEGAKKIVLQSGFRVGKNRRNRVYIPCRPPLGHGPHRYFFELIALKEKLDPEKLSAVPTKEELLELVPGKVAGWGCWVGVFETEWE